ncbi:glycoside hydrolase family 2 TIM barrel-domain containing protein [Kiritimatiellota bacterium B12222]|nr:glycoside hydrolase family 2 TIM barrel-domain containing protein [Kiritimatiellota bacterium B12222]
MKKQTIHALEFTRNGLGGPWECWRGEKYTNHFNLSWEKVSLPHCWNAFDCVDPDVPYYEGDGWYRSKLKLDNPYVDGRTLLHFEGTGQRATVYVHTTAVHRHVGAYDEWEADITDAAAAYLQEYGGDEVPVAIHCDNRRDLETIPSDVSDFNLYGGIYRPLHLSYLPSLAWDQVFCEPEVMEGKGTLRLVGSLRGTSPGAVTVRIQVSSPDGEVVVNEHFRSGAWEGEKVLVNAVIQDVSLWHPEHPLLYEVQVDLESEGGVTTREFVTAFRKIEWIQNGPFFLNGERLLLQGTHRHEDHAGLAQAMPEELIREEMKLMKDMGVNFIRLGHYQQSEAVLDCCDRLGILVWEEIPWCRGGIGGEGYRAQCLSMLENMISQHRNHPSVMIWGLGNENDWPADFEVFDEEEIRQFMMLLHERSHAMDPARKTAIRRCAFCADVVDVYSPSIWAGWYRGLYTDYKQATLDEIAKVDHFLHVEWGGDNHAGRHTENSARGLEQIEAGQGADEKDGDYFLTGGDARASKDTDWTETYFCDLIDWHLKEQETMPELTGTAQWPFKDFSTPVRPENPVPYVNQKGVVERDLTPKEGYYVFQSYWTREPMLRIYGHSWPVRWGEKGGTNWVKVYSNCAEVELFLNGESQGLRKRDAQDFPAAGLRWDVQFQEGKNDLRAVGTNAEGQVVEDTLSQNFQSEVWGAPAAIRLIKEEGDENTKTITVQLVDEHGVPCLDAKDFFHFTLAGEGQLIENLGTSRGSRRVGATNGRAEISLKTMGQTNVLGVSVEGVSPLFVTLESEEGN